MMNCEEYRRVLLADPGHPSAEMRVHVAHCHDCTQYTDRVLRFEGRLARALQIDIGEAPAGRVAPELAGLGTARSGTFSSGAAGSGTAGVSTPGLRRNRGSSLRRRGLAIAASVLLAVFGGGLLWLAAPGRSLAAAVVNHMAGEPGAWARTAVAVPEPKLDVVMSESGAHLTRSAGLVSYVHSCEFRGHHVPHLVVQTAAGPVTVMVLIHEPVPRDVRFNEQGYRGMIVPVPDHGSLAVLERGANTDMKAVEAVAAQVLDALAWR